MPIRRRAVLTALTALTALAGLAGQPALHAAPLHPVSREQAQILTLQAASFAKTHGLESLVDAVNGKDRRFVQGALYLVVLDDAGRHLAHPYDVTLIGQALLDVPDADGRQFRRERLALAQGVGQGWVDYTYRNPQNGELEPKSAFVLRVPGGILSAGAYMERPRFPGGR